MLGHMRQLLEFFRPHLNDTETLDRLRNMIDDRGAWPRAHHLFDHIRHKTLRAERAKDAAAETQYLFEEACAKTLFNLTHTNAPFDADSPYWIVPNALMLARTLGLDPMTVQEIVTGSE
ncbi:hypothetical protein DPM33_31795 [Mesorhizobium hawassense]|uniref:Uncharacterized protein n=1 Tax=Mesorhizobium hawassense TaxID=1209954 RepID=A0A330H6R0_9HYPH|nr:hypothetical protein [Mesorhizobium hawassense]RAZ84361.1 hypothetical protein DPM33_31795 [Mesorhizobium hawassense]